MIPTRHQARRQRHPRSVLVSRRAFSLSRPYRILQFYLFLLSLSCVCLFFLFTSMFASRDDGDDDINNVPFTAPSVFKIE